MSGLRLKQLDEAICIERSLYIYTHIHQEMIIIKPTKHLLHIFIKEREIVAQKIMATYKSSGKFDLESTADEFIEHLTRQKKSCFIPFCCG